MATSKVPVTLGPNFLSTVLLILPGREKEMREARRFKRFINHRFILLHSKANNLYQRIDIWESFVKGIEAHVRLLAVSKEDVNLSKWLQQFCRLDKQFGQYIKMALELS